ncbi:CgeB family protein [Pedobacter mucosus]|uniref:CgeB family protein n=1 Tax=Pedobacter mucosus TaxID=2895286 RepID=UPI001EE3F39E|nr:glycosyltransferase [Pedobacter mucosus]UKT65379.1 glycosyltransferase family 1 protein [Pedobacter mucosus]
MHIIYLGEDREGTTTAHRAQALQRIGHQVTVINPLNYISAKHKKGLLNAIHFRSGYRLLQSAMLRWLEDLLPKTQKPDLVWVDSGEFFGPTFLKALKSVGCPIILYNIDDPTGKRDGRRFDLLRKAISCYDLVVVVRQETAEECIALGARKVIRVNRSYDEVAHLPFADQAMIPTSLRSEVAFIGTWMRGEKRDEFLLELIEKGVPLSIWGNGWEKSHLFSRLKPAFRGPSLEGRDYIAAIQGAKICIGLLSKGNRDLHTTRSYEVPYAGGLLCAKRTTEHQALYLEDEEAVFWSNAEECATRCLELLKNDKREKMRLSGMRKVRAIGAGNEDVCRKIMDELCLEQ